MAAASRTASRLAEGNARAQENGRFAQEFLQRDIRMAGHFGCVNDQAHFVRDFKRFMGMSPSRYAALDHPVHPGLPETAYLKAMTLQID